MILTEHDRLEIKKLQRQCDVCPYRLFLNRVFGWHWLTSMCRYRKIFKLEVQRQHQVEEDEKYDQERYDQ